MFIVAICEDYAWQEEIKALKEQITKLEEMMKLQSESAAAMQTELSSLASQAAEKVTLSKKSSKKQKEPSSLCPLLLSPLTINWQIFSHFERDSLSP